MGVGYVGGLRPQPLAVHSRATPLPLCDGCTTHSLARRALTDPCSRAARRAHLCNGQPTCTRRCVRTPAHVRRWIPIHICKTHIYLSISMCAYVCQYVSVQRRGWRRCLERSSNRRTSAPRPIDRSGTAGANSHYSVQRSPTAQGRCALRRCVRSASVGLAASLPAALVATAAHAHAEQQ